MRIPAIIFLFKRSVLVLMHEKGKVMINERK